jgi:hypothetical protein
VNRPAVASAGSFRQLLRFAAAAGWLLLAASIWFVPKPRRPGGELPTWKLVVWFILFLILASVVAFVSKGGPGPGGR